MSTVLLGLAAVAPKHIRITLLGVMLGMLLAMLDSFIVGKALPTIVVELGGVALLSWVVSAYELTTAVTTPVWGELGDLFGRKIIFQQGYTLAQEGNAKIQQHRNGGLGSHCNRCFTHPHRKSSHSYCLTAGVELTADP